jgi:hypothetical protein
MPEDSFFIERSISHFGAMLKLDLDDEDRGIVTQLRDEAERKLGAAATSVLPILEIPSPGRKRQ